MFLYTRLNEVLYDLKDELARAIQHPEQVEYLNKCRNLNQYKYKLFEYAENHHIQKSYDFNEFDSAFKYNPDLDRVKPRNRDGMLGALSMLNKSLVGEDELTLAMRYQYLVDVQRVIDQINQMRTDYVFSILLRDAKLYQNDKASPENLNKILLVTKKWLKEFEK